MPMVVSNHQRIFFRFEGERGAFLMLHHGLFGSHQDWYRAGYVEELSKEFRLVIPDARGHGRSDHPSELADYRPERFAEDLIEIINGLGIRNLHFLGYGMGALIGLEMLRRFPERVRIAVLGGEAPLMLPPVHEHWRSLAERLERGTLGELVAELRVNQQLVRLDDANPPEEERASALALVQAVAGWDAHGEERISVTSPVTLFAGADDPAAERVERARAYVNRARLVLFPGLNHAKLFEERTQVAQELVRLLKSGRREDGDTQHRRHGPEGTEARSGGEGHVPRGEERRSGRQDDRPPERQDDRRNRDRRNGGRRDFRRPGDRGEARQNGGSTANIATSSINPPAGSVRPQDSNRSEGMATPTGANVQQASAGEPLANKPTETSSEPQATASSPDDRGESSG